MPRRLRRKKKGTADGEEATIGEKGQMESGRASVNRNGKEYICFDAAICEKSETEMAWCSLILSLCVFSRAVDSAVVRKTRKQNDISLL